LGIGIWGLRRLDARGGIEHNRIRVLSYLYIPILYKAWLEGMQLSVYTFAIELFFLARVIVELAIYNKLNVGCYLCSKLSFLRKLFLLASLRGIFFNNIYSIMFC
jgi:hypothetical protein